MEAIQRVFEDSAMTVITIEDKPWFVAHEVGKVLGYAENGSRLSNKIGREWSSELVEGHDFRIAVKKELSAIKELDLVTTDSVGTNVVSKMARNLMLLSEQGVFLVCMKTNKEVGVRLRRWLADEVLPKLRRGELVLAGGAKAEALAYRRRQQELVANSERRRQNRRVSLEEKKLELERDKFEAEQAQRRANSAWNILAMLAKDEDLDEQVIRHAKVRLTAKMTGIDFQGLLPTARGASPSEMAHRWETDKGRIGRIITALGLRGSAHSFPGSSAPNEAGRVYPTWTYDGIAQQQIKAALDAGEIK